MPMTFTFLAVNSPPGSAIVPPVAPMETKRPPGRTRSSPSGIAADVAHCSTTSAPRSPGRARTPRAGARAPPAGPPRRARLDAQVQHVVGAQRARDLEPLGRGADDEHLA